MVVWCGGDGVVVWCGGSGGDGGGGGDGVVMWWCGGLEVWRLLHNWMVDG